MKKIAIISLALIPILGFSAKSHVQQPSDQAQKLQKISSDAYSPERRGFGYVDISAELPLPFPGVTVGYREIYGRHGLDVSAGVISCFNITDFSSNLRYINYLKNSRKYFAVGLTADLIYGSSIDYVVFSPALSIGKESNKSFYQFDLSVIRLSDWGVDLVSTVTCRYGMKF